MKHKFRFDLMTGDDVRMIVKDHTETTMMEVMEFNARMLGLPVEEVRSHHIEIMGREFGAAMMNFFADLLDSLEKERFQEIVRDIDFSKVDRK